MKSLFEQIDLERLINLANSITLNDFYSFGGLLNRLEYYWPKWADAFLEGFDWSRVLKIVLNAESSSAYAVDKLVGSLVFMRSSKSAQSNLQYLEDIVPFVIRAIEDNPVNTINSMQDIFWDCLGLAPSDLRTGEPNNQQLQIARRIFSQINPRHFALAMKHIISRDMENLARSLSIIHEVKPEFISQIASLVPEEDFHIAAKLDWHKQSVALMNLLRFFCIGKEHQPARNWIVRNQQIIEGPLEPMLASVAPQGVHPKFEISINA